MNLLTDSWIDVRNGASIERVSLEHLLTVRASYACATPRDDLDAALVEMLAAIVQVLFPDADERELLDREKQPVSSAVYRARASKHVGRFDLASERAKFMQSSVVDKTPAAAGLLLPGAPGRTSHLWFDRAAAPKRLCYPCAALALFARATFAPSFGGGFCASLRGNAPLTVTVEAPDLRRTIWRNVLSSRLAEEIFPASTLRNDFFTWESPPPEGVLIPATSIGIERGLFWQPARVELLPDLAPSTCQLCGASDVLTTSRLRKAKFKVSIEGLWPHPRGLRYEYYDKTTKSVRSAMFGLSSREPLYAILSRLSDVPEAGTGTFAVPPILAQHLRLWPDEPLVIRAFGFRASQAKLELRSSQRLELADFEALEAARFAISVRRTLTRGLRRATAAALGERARAIAASIEDEAERAFDAATESIVVRAAAAGEPLGRAARGSILAHSRRVYGRLVDRLGAHSGSLAALAVLGSSFAGELAGLAASESERQRTEEATE